jgi:hypothetical protein
MVPNRAPPLSLSVFVPKLRRRSRFSQPTLGFASPDFIFVLVFVPVRPLPQVPRPSSILGEARRCPSGRDLESPASFVLSEHRAAGCRFVLRALGFGAAGWLSVFCSRRVSSSIRVVLGFSPAARRRGSSDFARKRATSRGSLFTRAGLLCRHRPRTF